MVVHIGQDVEKIPDENIPSCPVALGEPVIHQPVGDTPHVGGPCGRGVSAGQRWVDHNHEHFVRVVLHIVQQLVVESFNIRYCLDRIAATGGVVGLPVEICRDGGIVVIDIRIRIARFDDDDLVFPTWVGQLAGIVAIVGD